MCERDRETKKDEDRLPYWLITSSLDHTTCYLCLFCVPARGHYGPLTNRPPGGQSPWLTLSRYKTSDWRLPPCKTTHICYGPCIYNFTTFNYSGCHSRDVLPLIYRGVSCNRIVYTAGTSDSVKGQYATMPPKYGRQRTLMTYFFDISKTQKRNGRKFASSPIQKKVTS